jgi:hypothetical protein
LTGAGVDPEQSGSTGSERLEDQLPEHRQHHHQQRVGHRPTDQPVDVEEIEAPRRDEERERKQGHAGDAGDVEGYESLIEQH